MRAASVLLVVIWLPLGCRKEGSLPVPDDQASLQASKRDQAHWSWSPSSQKAETTAFDRRQCTFSRIAKQTTLHCAGKREFTHTRHNGHTAAALIPFESTLLAIYLGDAQHNIDLHLLNQAGDVRGVVRLKEKLTGSGPGSIHVRRGEQTVITLTRSGFSLRVTLPNDFRAPFTTSRHAYQWRGAAAKPPQGAIRPGYPILARHGPYPPHSEATIDATRCVHSHDPTTDRTRFSCVNGARKFEHTGDFHHEAASMVHIDGTLYVVRFHPISAGATLTCYDLQTGWESCFRHLYAEGPIGHSKYFNNIDVRLTAGKLFVFGNTASGKYLEVVRPDTLESEYYWRY